MKNTLATFTLFFVTFACLPSQAQETNPYSGPAKEHEFLKKFVGSWDLESEGSTGEGQPTIKATAVMNSRMLGQLWLVNATGADVGGTRMDSLQTIGYDPNKKKYVGTWVDSMMNHMWQYEGTVDETGKKLVLEAEGPDMMAPGKTTAYQDAYEFKTDDLIVTTSSMLGKDGKWITFMTGTATRKK